MRKAPKIIIAIILLVFVGWGGFWFIGAKATEKVLSAWLADRREEGWVADYGSLDTRGFPNRFDTTITDLRLADPDTGFAWSAPELQSLSLSYAPTDVIAILPGAQVFGTPEGSHTITADLFRASATMRPEISVPVEQSIIVLENARIASSNGMVTELEGAQVSMRETPGRQGHVYDFDITASNIRPDPNLVANARASGAIADVIEKATVRATIRFDNAFDRYAIERARPQPREIELTRLAAKWGAVTLDATGILIVGADGIPEGQVDVKAQNWREMIRVAQASGALAAPLASAITGAGQVVARMSGNPDTLDATLRFEKGRAFLGPIPIGAAPVIRIP